MNIVIKKTQNASYSWSGIGSTPEPATYGIFDADGVKIGGINGKAGNWGKHAQWTAWLACAPTEKHRSGTRRVKSTRTLKEAKAAAVEFSAPLAFGIKAPY